MLLNGLQPQQAQKPAANRKSCLLLVVAGRSLSHLFHLRPGRSTVSDWPPTCWPGQVLRCNVIFRCGLACSDLDSVELREAQLTPDGAERVVGSALSQQVMSEDAPVFAEGVKPVLLPKYLVAGMENVMAIMVSPAFCTMLLLLTW